MTVRGLTSGCFDLCHVGHILYLQRCKLLCDELIVGVDSDELVRKTKGPRRLIISENERLDLVRNLGFVAEAFLLNAPEDLETVAKELGIHKVFKHQKFQGMKNVYGTLNTGAKLVIIPDTERLNDLGFSKNGKTCDPFDWQRPQAHGFSHGVDGRLNEVLREVAAEAQAEILEIEVMPDHVHLLVEVDPQFGIYRLIKLLKGRSSRLLRQEFPWLKKRLPSLWINSYFVSTVGGAPLAVVKHYIESQKHV